MRSLDIDPEEVARSLMAARRTCVPAVRPVDLSMPIATAIRAEFVRLLTNDTLHDIVGYKVSLGATWGALTEDVVFTGPTTLHRHSVIDPLLEAELVFLLEAELSPESSVDEIMDRCRVAVGIEIADSRWDGWLPRDPERFVLPSAAEIAADNAVCGGLVLSDTSVSARDLPLPDLDIAMSADGVEVARGSLANVMGHPAEAVRWLIQLLAKSGASLRPGQMVSSGCPYQTYVTVPREGGTWEAAVDGLGSAIVTFDGDQEVLRSADKTVRR